MTHRPRIKYTTEQRNEIWDRWQRINRIMLDVM